MPFGVRLPSHIRGYATRRPLNALGLDHFIQRTKVISFYRTILRGTKHIADAQTKAESRRYAREEFERHRNVKDLVPVINW